ncbi:hypothetical protein C5167_006433, partial [Papaver somniferum]
MGSFSGLAAGIKPALNFEVEGSFGAVNDMATTMVQKFWDSALVISGTNAAAISCSESAFMASDSVEPGMSYPFLGLGNSFAFKFEDHKGYLHLLNCSTVNLEELVSTCEDDEGNKVLLTTDSELAGAIIHAPTTGTTGIVDYTNNDEMKYVVVSKNSMTEFRYTFSEAYIQVKEYDSKNCQIQEGKLEIEPGNLDWHVLPVMRSNFGFAFDEVGLLKRIQVNICINMLSYLYDYSLSYDKLGHFNIKHCMSRTIFNSLH